MLVFYLIMKNKDNKQRLTVIENEIKQMISEDKTNPEIYNKIFELVYKYFLRNKIVKDYGTAKEIATTMAEDLYLRLFDPNKPQISSWLGFISLDYHTYLRWYRKETDTVIDTKGDVDFSNSVIHMFAGSQIDNSDIEDIYSLDYMESLPKIIEDVMDSSRIPKYSKEYLNTRLTLLLSILYDRFIPFRLSVEDTNYARMLYRMLCDKLMVELHPTVSSDSLNLLQFYLLDDEGGSEKWTF